MQFIVRHNDFERSVARGQQRYMQDMGRAGRYAADRVSLKTQKDVKERMGEVGLGRLANAVGQSSAAKKRQAGMWGVIYAKGKQGADDRGAGALEAYSKGVEIRARNGTWLAYATNAIPRLATTGGGRRRMTPKLYLSSGWVQRLGPLTFRPINPMLALLVVKDVTLHPRTGRAKPAGPGRTRTRIPKKETVVFVLIRKTSRAQRFNEKDIARFNARYTPKYMEEWFAAHPG
jgi:hypothetical protein